MPSTLDEVIERCKCTRPNPCDVVCQLENFQLDLVMNKGLRSYEIGGEKFTIFRPNMTELQALINHYKKLCADCAAGGDGITRRRANKVFIHSDARVRRGSGCGC